MILYDLLIMALEVKNEISHLFYENPTDLK